MVGPAPGKKRPVPEVKDAPLVDGCGEPVLDGPLGDGPVPDYRCTEAR